MATSKFIKYFRDNVSGNPAIGMSVWLVPQSITNLNYPSDFLVCTAHPTRDGVYYREAVPDGEYKIYIDVLGGTIPVLYDEHIYVSEQRLTDTADNFDSNNKLKYSALKELYKSVNIVSFIPDFIGQVVKNTEDGSFYIATSLVNPYWELLNVSSGGGTVVVDNVTIDNASGVLKVKDGGIGSAKIANGSVTNTKLADSAVTNSKIMDSAVTASKLADTSVTSTKINDGAVTTSKLTDKAVTPSKIDTIIKSVDFTTSPPSPVPDFLGQIGLNVDGKFYIATSLTTSPYWELLTTSSGSGTVNVDGITIDDSTGVLKVKDGGIAEVKLADSAVSSVKLQDNAITTSKILNSSITTDKLADNSITNSKISSNAITSTKIADEAILPQKLSSLIKSINLETPTPPDYIGQLGKNIDDNYYIGISKTVSPYWELLSSATSASVNVDNITIEDTGGILKVKDFGITAAKLADNSVTTNKILDGAVTASKLSESLSLPQGMKKFDIPDLHIYQSFFVNESLDNFDAASPKIIVTAQNPSYIEISFIPPVKEILNPEPNKVLIYDTDTADHADLYFGGDYYQGCAVLQSVDYVNKRLYCDFEATPFAVGHKIAISVPFRNVNYKSQIIPDEGLYTFGAQPHVCYEHSNGRLRLLFNGREGATSTEPRQNFLGEFSEDMQTFTILNNGQPIFQNPAWCQYGFWLSPNALRIGDGTRFISPIFGKNLYSDVKMRIGFIEFDEDFTNVNTFQISDFPLNPSYTTLEGGFGQSVLFMQEGKYHIIVSTRYEAANYPTWRLEEYYTNDTKITASTTWIWKRQLPQPVNNVSFVASHIDALFYFEYQNTPMLMVGGTTYYNASGLKAHRGYGFLYYNGDEWVYDKRGAVFNAMYRVFNVVNSGVFEDDLTYLGKHLGGYNSLINYRGKTYFLFSSLMTTNQYKTGIAELKSYIDFENPLQFPHGNANRKIIITRIAQSFTIDEYSNDKIYEVNYGVSNPVSIVATISPRFRNGYTCQIVNMGTTQITFQSSDTIVGKGTTCINQYGTVFIYKENDIIRLIGDLQ